MHETYEKDGHPPDVRGEYENKGTGESNKTRAASVT